MLVISTARHRIAPPLHVRRSDRFGLRVRRRAALVGVALVTAGFVPMVLASPAGAAPPVFSFSESAPATVLYGTPATVSLSATETNTVTGYNLSIEDVLPAGVSYVTGSTTPSTIGDPQILTNEPSSGKTTLIWSNVSDLQPSSSFALGFQLQGAIDTTLPTPTTILYPGDSYSDSATAYVESDPREVPQFDTSGDASNYTTTVGPVSGTTEISPFETTITDPLPEHELERGVHDQQKIWTLTVTDNSVHATALNAITAWLPAGLEFLGCGGVDNTTSPTTTDSSDPGPAPFLEYPGAPALGAGVTIRTSGSPTGAPSSAPCAPATAVSTEDTAVPPGLTSSSNESNPVYTTAQWVFGSGTGDLSATTLQPGQTYTIRYLAAVPLLENTMTFNGGAPSGADAEASNLDNNNGADTLTLSTGTGSDQTTAAQATGTYSGTFGSGANPASADGQDTVTIHDVAIQKTVSSPNFVEGSDVNFTLDYETSEYRYSQSAVITDILPNGMCPISATPLTTPIARPSRGATLPSPIRRSPRTKERPLRRGASRSRGTSARWRRTSTGLSPTPPSTGRTTSSTRPRCSVPPRPHSPETASATQ
jgi:hypothetical protein